MLRTSTPCKTGELARTIAEFQVDVELRRRPRKTRRFANVIAFLLRPCREPRHVYIYIYIYTHTRIYICLKTYRERYIDIPTRPGPESRLRGVQVVARGEDGRDSSKEGAVETGCSELYDGIYELII